MAEQQPVRFFITHSWHDNEFTLKLTRDLRAHGFDGFLDVYSVKPGDNIPAQINRGLETCDVYIPILSSASLKSKWCEREINAALMLSGEAGRGGRPLLIPVLAEDCAKNLPPLLKPLLYISFFNRYPDAFKDLLAGLNVLRGTEAASIVEPAPKAKPRTAKKPVERKPTRKVKPPIAKKTTRSEPVARLDEVRAKLRADLETAEKNQEWNYVVSLGEKFLAYDDDPKLKTRIALAYHERAIKNTNGKNPDYDAALNDFNRAIELDPSNALYYNNRGVCQNNQRFSSGTGDYARAIADHTRAIELDPTHSEFYQARGKAYRNAGDWKKALADGWEAGHLGTMNVAEFQATGWDYYNQGKYDLAIAYFTRGLQMESNADMLAGRGMSYYAKNEYDHALADFDRAIKMDPKHASYYLSRSFCYEDQKNFDRALADLDQGIQLKPKNLATYFQCRGRVHYRKTDYPRAIADCSRALELDAKYAAAYFVRGLVYRDQGDATRARDDFSHAIQFDPQVAAYHRERGKSYKVKGDLVAARRDLQKASELGDAEAKGLLTTL
ncbi:MAG: tetratricopeptide repeat protein [Chloroflexi bacterium]|nr:tetratricopeptide repeat protein [Chloroflexota bacterium]